MYLKHPDKMIDLNLLSQMVDDFFDEQTPESLTKLILDKRRKKYADPSCLLGKGNFTESKNTTNTFVFTVEAESFNDTTYSSNCNNEPSIKIKTAA